ncbi:MAG: carbohydrate-binding domain-containing protein [Lachnospiraceae bacterium]|nr:carbohydrate-binding domain-containing protein [Lachnospiraceae bacterium]
MMQKRNFFRQKILAWMISFAMIFASFGGAAAYAEDSGTAADLSGMTTFVFDGDSVTVTEGDGANYEVVIYDDTDTETAADTSTDADGNTVYSVPEDSDGQLLVLIKKKGGSYVFQGSGNGSIAVKKEATGDAVLYLNGLELTSAFTAVITVKKDSTASCTICAVEGTENILTDNEYNNDTDFADNAAAENAVMKFKDSSDVTLTGDGTININANGKNGIKANGALAITGDLVLNITSVNDGINSESEDGLNVLGGTITVSAADDAIHADYVLNLGAEGGSDDDLSINILTCSEGLEGAIVNLYSGTYTISASDDCINGANSDLTDYDYEINIYGGTIYASTTAGDCLDSNGDLNISGGTVIALGALDNTEETNNALDCDGTFMLTGGTVLGIGMQEMSVVPSSSQAYVTWTSAGESTAVEAGSEDSDSGMPGGGDSAMPADGGGSEITAAASETAASDTGSLGESAVSSTMDPSDAGDSDVPGDGGESDPGSGNENGPGSGNENGPGSGNENGPGSGNEGDSGGSSQSGLVSNGNVVTVYDSENQALITVTASWDSEDAYSVDYVFYSSESVTAGSTYTLTVEDTDDGNGSGEGDTDEGDGNGEGDTDEGDGSGDGDTDEGDGSGDGDTDTNDGVGSLGAEADESLTFDSSAWQYNSGSDVYYQTGVVYCTDPYDTTYESFGIYVPAAYMNMTSNGDGTYTFVSFTDTAVGDYTASTAPIVIPVNTAGYAAQAAPAGFSSGVTTYTDERIVYLYAGCRGRDTINGGAPWGVTDLKAAIRYYRYNADVLPGDTDSIFSFGHSGGGAQSSVLGASGDSELYYPYLYSIGAAGITYDEETDTYTSTISDAECGAMCWCPITSLDYADEAYEWMMGQYSGSGTRADSAWTSLLSDDMSEAFAEYINSLTLEDEDGNVLTLTDDEDGIYLSGTYYEYLLYQIEYSLNDFIDSYTDEDGNFSYSSSGSSSGGPGGGGTAPDFGGLASLAMSQLSAESESALVTAADTDALTTYLLTLDENYGTDEAWITYDTESDWYSIRSVEDFVLYGSKSASKDVGAFDDLNTTQAENYVFGSGSGQAAHFDSLMAELMAENYAVYAAADSSVSASDILAYASDYQYDYDNYTSDAVLGYSSQYRQNMYNPMYYLCQDYEGYGTSSPASYWRINTGITQSDTSLTVEMNLYLALTEDIADDNSSVEDVDFAMHWAQGHTTAERAGADSGECFIEWISACMIDQASSSDDGSGGTDDGSGDADDERGGTDAEHGGTDDPTGGTDDESDDTDDEDAGTVSTDTLAVRRGTVFYFTSSIENPDESVTRVTYGTLTDGDEILIGDWDGDGIDTVARRSGNTYYFSAYSDDNTLVDVTAYTFGKDDDEVLVGDWDGDGVDTLAVRRSGNIYYFSNSSSDANDLVTRITYGRETDEILAGDWDGTGSDTLAARRSGNIYYFAASVSDPDAGVLRITYGRSEDEAYAGRWN